MEEQPMKNTRALLLILALLCAVLLTSCKDTPENPGESESDTQTEEKIMYDIVKDGITDYKIIRADASGKETMAVASELWSRLYLEYGVGIEFVSDYSVDNKENATVESGADVHEILIGKTNRLESRTVEEEYATEYVSLIKAVNGKVVIYGSDDTQTARAVRYFLDNVATGKSFSVEEGVLLFEDAMADGSPLSTVLNDFRWVYSSGVWTGAKGMIDSVAREMGERVGVTPEIFSDSKVGAEGRELLVGITNRAASISAEQEIDFMDYTVRVTSDCIVLIGGNHYATQKAVDHFFDALIDGTISSLEEGYEYTYDFDPLIEDSLINRVDSFVPAWAGEFTVPGWMLDFDEKLYALTTSDGRFACTSHAGGDLQHYPQNSLEAILSALMLGTDMIELDIRLTKDNVMVLMHDSTLNKTTNVDRMKGKNGLPTSNKVADWTYEQLRELRLLYKGEVTDYRIPTLYEAMSLIKGRAQVSFDIKSDAITKEGDLYELARSLDAETSCIAWLGGASSASLWAARDPSDEYFAGVIDRLQYYLTLPGHSFRTRSFNKFLEVGDGLEAWNKQFNSGTKLVYTDTTYDLCRYIAENQQPFAIPKT